MARLRLDSVGKVYENGYVGVHRIDLDVASGEFVVLVGPSGCGKTTTLRMIAGLESVSSGAVLMGDRDVTNLEPKDRDIAMVFQSYALYPHMTVFENMAFALKLRGTQRAEIGRRVRDVADILDLTPVLNRKPRALSGGQRQRVAIGRAIVREPALFLFDEPLSNLDAKLRVQMRREIAQLHRRLGTTVVYVTHDQVEAMTLGDRIVVMHEGRVQQVDTPLGVYDHPVNTFVARFIGTPPMNLIPGTITDDGLVSLAGDSVRVTLPYPLPGALAEYCGREITVGVRPEHLALVPDATENTSTLQVQIDMLEPLGNEVLVYGSHGPLAVTARVAPHALPVTLPQRGSVVAMQPDAGRLHFFDPGTGSAVVL